MDSQNIQRVQTRQAFADVSALLEEGVKEGVFPGAVLAVGVAGELVHLEAAGSRSSETDEEGAGGSMSADTVFDVASLTGPVVTATLFMKLLEENKIKLSERVSCYLPGFGVFGKSPITFAHLLSHTGGLPSWVAYFEELLKENAGARMGILTSRGARDYVINVINRSHLKYPPGAKQLYSDVGLIILGHLAEILTGLPLDRAAFRYIFNPLRMRSSSFIDLSLIKRRGIHPVTDLIAPTEYCSWRKRTLCGEVHDDNAWAMGGVAGHSGLFSTARDLHEFASEMILALHGRSAFVSQNTIRTFWSPARPDLGTMCLGWDTPNSENLMGSSGLSAGAVGMNGFTGCSLWIEPERGVDIILMSNRVHPNRSNKKILAYRPIMHDAVLAAVEKL